MRFETYILRYFVCHSVDFIVLVIYFELNRFCSIVYGFIIFPGKYTNCL